MPIGATSAKTVAGFSISGAGSSLADSSRLTNTRFLRTSTCTVRVLPAESAWRISVVSRLVRVIFLRAVVSEP